MTPAQVLIWTQHLLGTGHLHRSLRLASAIADQGPHVTVMSGGPALPVEPCHNVAVEQLPALQTSDTAFSELLDTTGHPASEAIWQERATRIAALLNKRPADLIITEMFPFGRKAFRREIEAMLTVARRIRPNVRVLASVRDILVSKNDVERYRWCVEWIHAHYDDVLVHGDPEFIAFAESFPLSGEIADRLFHTGYIAQPMDRQPNGRKGVIVSAGGGAVGASLIETALGHAMDTGPVNGPWTLIAGHRVEPQRLDGWRRQAPAHVTIKRHVQDLPKRIGRAVLSISQAGYNTIAETISLRTPMLLVPFETESEDEQLRRAMAVERAGFGVVLREADLTATTFAEAVERARRLRPDSPPPRTDGAQRGARRIMEWLAR
ncbi:MAG: hypothetical protein H6851_08995 [Geminicoccaceae bacterium]|nr:hypothetical protein [Geminicoccaceae bacterium]